MTKSVIVSSTKGGTGKTLTSINLAHELNKQGKKVGFIDADIESSNFAEFLNVSKEERIKVSEDKNFIPYDWDGIKVFSMSLVSDRERGVSMTGGVHRRLLNDIVKSTEWGDIDLFVVDLPSGASDIFRESIKVFGGDLAGGIIVMQPINRTDAKRILNLHKSYSIPILGVVENMAYFEIKYGKGKKRYHIFGEPIGKKITDEFNAPYLGEIPLSIGITKGVEEGNPIIPEDLRSPIEKGTKNVMEAGTVSVLGKLKSRVKGAIKHQAEKIFTSFLITSNRKLSISDIQDQYNFHERRPFDFVIVSDNREKVLSRTHCKVLNGKLKALKNADVDFEIELPFGTFCQMIMGKRKINGKVYEYDAEEAWLEGQLRVYGKGSSPRLVQVTRKLFNEQTLKPIRKKYGNVLTKFI